MIVAEGSLLAMNIQKRVRRMLGLGSVLVLSLGTTGCDQLWDQWIEETEGLPGVDALAPDADGDKLPDDFDCAPDDAAVTKTATRECTLASGEKGEQSCYYGMWGSCDEVPVEGCQAGETREVNCGLCGQQTEQCVSGEWVAQGECSDQGVCEPGERSEHLTGAAMSCGSAVQYYIVCTDSCQWSEELQDKKVIAGCRRDQCCDGMNCIDMPSSRWCIPMPERMKGLESEGPIIYPEDRE